MVDDMTLLKQTKLVCHIRTYVLSMSHASRARRSEATRLRMLDLEGGKGRQVMKFIQYSYRMLYATMAEVIHY